MRRLIIVLTVFCATGLALGLTLGGAGETNLSAKDEGPFSNLTHIQKLELSAESVLVGEKEILQGLEGVLVLVDYIQPELEKYGLTRRVLHIDTELLLRQYGIKVFNYEETLPKPGHPYLYIDVDVVIADEFPMAALAIEVGLSEAVLLLREPERICFGACTWHREKMVLCGFLRIKDIREVVKEYVNEFIYDHLAVNPKEKAMDTKKQNW